MGEIEKYSYSKLDTYVQCPFKYKLRYVDKHSVFCNSINTEIGTAIHACEEKIAKYIQAKKPIDYVSLKNELLLTMFKLQAKYKKDFDTPDKSDRTFITKIYDYLDSGIYRLEQFMNEYPNFEIVGIEQPFKILYKDKYILNGFIDRVFYDTSTKQYFVQDIKTYAVEVEKEKLVTPLQFVVYALAVKELYNCDYSQINCQYYLPFCNLTQDAGTKGFLDRGVIKMDKIFSSIEQQDWHTNQSPLCHYCEYCQTNPNAPDESKYLCPYFSHWTKEHKNFSKENEWSGLENHKTILENYYKKYKINVKE